MRAYIKRFPRIDSGALPYFTRRVFPKFCGPLILLTTNVPTFTHPHRSIVRPKFSKTSVFWKFPRNHVADVSMRRLCFCEGVVKTHFSLCPALSCAQGKPERRVDIAAPTTHRAPPRRCFPHSATSPLPSPGGYLCTRSVARGSACQEIAMTDATVTVTTAPSPAPAPAPTLGASLDAELTVVKARLAVLESVASTDWSKVKAWFGTNWPHFVSWAASGSLLADKLGLLKL